MQVSRWYSAAFASALVLAASTASAASYKVMKGGVKDGGTLQGRVTYNGTAPAPAKVVVDEDVEACGGPERLDEELLVSSSGGISNVVLAIEDVTSGKDWDLPESFVYDQKTCRFSPRILVIQPKAEGEVLNSDTIGHNFHTISKGIFNVNKKIQPDSKLVVNKNKIRKTGLIRAKCDIHSWMGGHWVVAETPYTVVSDAEGNFTISDIPPGTYTLKVWHEKLGESSQQIVIKAGETTKSDLALSL